MTNSIVTKSCYSLFSGCGGSDVGMAMAGYESMGGIEYHQPAADIYNLNHDCPVTVADILTINSIPTADLLWLSPPCPSFSIANTNRGETNNDLNLALHLVKLIKDSKPSSIAIENVRGYAQSQSLVIITSTLLELGYEVRQSIECAANYGTPTTRERLIVRASKSPIRNLIHTHQKPSNQLSMFALPDWVSWWDAIACRIQELPKSHITENQKTSVANWRKKDEKSKILIDGVGNNYGTDFTIRAENEPSNTLTALTTKHPHRILINTAQNRIGCGGNTIVTDRDPAYTISAEDGKRATARSKILIERVGYYGGSPSIYDNDIPAPTIRSAPHCDNKGTYRVAANILDGYDCYAADIVCLAAWQGFPVDYQWGNNRGQAGRAIGNAVPPQLARSVAQSLN